MKNNENRDQMIRETFDQCLSGIDELPSLRPDILRKAGTRTPARKPVPFRRYAVPAAMALLLCGGILGTSGLWSTGGREDQIRSSNLYLTQPIETALSMGTEQNPDEVFKMEQKDPAWNLFSWFGQEGYSPLLGRVAGKAAKVSDTMQGEAITAHIDSYYYDGETLILTAAIPEYRTEEYEPSEKERSGMKAEDMDPLDLRLGNLESGLREKWEESIRNQTPMGLVMYGQELESYLRDKDHQVIHKEDGTNPGSCMGSIELPEGTGYRYVSYIRYDEPLPMSVRNVESFDITLRVPATVTQYYFDGEALYSHSMYDYDRFDYISANVVNNHAEKHTYSGQGTLLNQELYANAVVSNASVRLSLSMNPDSGNAIFRFGKDYKGLLIAVQDDRGKTLAYDWIVFNPYDHDPDDNQYSFPVTLTNDIDIVVEEFPPEMKLYIQPIHYTEAEKENMTIQESGNEEVSWDEWGTEEGENIAEEEAYAEEKEDDPPEIEPGTEPFAILTMEK